MFCVLRKASFHYRVVCATFAERFNTLAQSEAVKRDKTPSYAKVGGEGTSKLYSYVYNYTDHLGNVRLSYTDDNGDGSLKILEESNYYPFGLKHTGYNGSLDLISLGGDPGKYNYKYNGKEL